MSIDLYAGYREDTLWSKYKEIKKVLDQPRGYLLHKQAGLSLDSNPRYDDSGRLVDMSEVQDNLFIGSE